MSSASIGGGFHFDNSKTWFTIFPDKGLLPGHSWTTMLDLGEGEYNMTNSTTYTLKTCSKKKAVINFAATISSAENSKISITSGDMSGMMVINPRTGAAIEIDQVQNIKMNIEEEDIKVPLTLESTAHMEVIR
jgi:hypothetical protein